MHGCCLLPGVVLAYSVSCLISVFRVSGSYLIGVLHAWIVSYCCSAAIRFLFGASAVGASYDPMRFRETMTVTTLSHLMLSRRINILFVPDAYNNQNATESRMKIQEKTTPSPSEHLRIST